VAIGTKTGGIPADVITTLISRPMWPFKEGECSGYPLTDADSARLRPKMSSDVRICRGPRKKIMPRDHLVKIEMTKRHYRALLMC